MPAPKVCAWVVALLALCSCTSAVDGASPAMPPSASPSPVASQVAVGPSSSPSPVAAAPSQDPTDGAACSVTRSTDIDTAATAGTPEGALTTFTSGRPTDFLPVVSGRRVTFYAKDGSRTVVVEPVERGWAATAVTEPSCIPGVVRRGAQSREEDLACKRAGGVSIAGTLRAQSELEAVADFIRFSDRPKRGPHERSTGDFVRIDGDDRPFGHFADGGLQTVIWVNGAGGNFAVDTITWC